ncbi:helix-turn-helix transcriptional regulator [Cryptosporangium minutisporangium]|uniref:Helix-turn-helix transcriptional regulator n=1 Tax=Cryptosporangium minutisporangium TaxID=113569 RepID=A0ABP6T3Y4_9ACTN
MELGDFLRTRRAALRPDDVGLVSYGARRVAGLRREELAQLAGVSVTYYTRLEQGHAPSVSDEVLDSIAHALRLDETEWAHLRDLARPVRKRRATPPPDHVRPGLRHLVTAIDGVAALVMDRRTDVLAWNPLAHVLLASHRPADDPARRSTRPNLTRMLFLDPPTRQLYARWDVEAQRAVASLRLVAGRFPDDRGLAELVGELCVKSPEFARLWSRHPVTNCTSGTKLFNHPAVGDLELGFEVTAPPDDSGQRLLMYSAAPGSSSEAALRLLTAAAYHSGG